MKQNLNSTNIDIHDLLSLLIRRWWIIITCIGVFTSLTGVYSYTRLTNYYSANATIYLGRENSAGTIDLGTISLNNQLMGDYMNLIRSRLVAEEVVKKLGTDIPVESIQAGLQAYSISTTTTPTRMFKIAYESFNPQFAADVVNATCEVVIMKADEVMGVKNAQIIDRALVPEFPIGPYRSKNILIAAVIGMILGILIILLIDYLDQTFKKPEDIEKILGLTVLGTIPTFRGEKR